MLESLRTALALIAALDRDVVSAVRVSLATSAWAVLIAAVGGVPLGGLVALRRFPLRGLVRVLLNSLMALPTVVIGLIVYGLLSREGLLGKLGLLFTPQAIVVGQATLCLPIVANYTLSAIQGADARILPTALTLGASRARCLLQLLREVRFGIVAAMVAGFGRAISEVGIAMMLGGNIRWYTRTMTTAIALESSKGELAFGLALGLILMLIALLINAVLSVAQESRHA